MIASVAAMLPASAAAAPPIVPPGQAKADQFAKGRILIEPRAGLSSDELDRVLSPLGGKRRKIGQSNLHIVELPGNGSEKAAVAVLSRNPHLKFAELDRQVAPNFVPNDPYYGSEAHLAVVGASSAWDVSQGNGITIAILDTGVDATHPDLAAQMVPGYNFYDNNADSSDVHGHGTAVAGTAAATLNNGQGVSGIAGLSKVMPLRISDPSGYAYYSTIAQGLTWAADRGARVANVSFEGVAGSSAIQSAAQYMKGKEGLVVVAAGNSGGNPGTAPTTAMIPVSATDNNDARMSWSSYGDYVAMSAPGALWTTTRGGSYQVWQGTSFSSPLTAGVVALMMAANPALGGTAVEKLLYSTAADLGAPGRDAYFGYGRVDAAAATRAAAATVPQVDRTPPAVSITAPYANSTVSGTVAVNVSASDNVGVSRVELTVGNNRVAVDSVEPFGFSWDSTGVPNGMAALTVTAFDAAGNSTVSSPVAVNVANVVIPPVRTDTKPPTVTISSPQPGSVFGNVTIGVNASDDSGPSGIVQSIYIDGELKATGTGTTLGFNWNTKKVISGMHTITAVAKDAAGNTSTASVQVSR